MRKVHFTRTLLCLFFVTIFILSCEKDASDTKPSEPQLLGFEVSDSEFGGLYVIDTTYNRGYKYVNEEDETEYLATFMEEDTEMWGMFKVQGSALYYYFKIESSDEYPPESGWTCGLGYDKPNFTCTPVYE